MVIDMFPQSNVDFTQLYSGFTLPSNVYINDLVQDCSNSSALAMELLQSCIKPSI